MTVAPRSPRRPLAGTGFHVRAAGEWIAQNVDEETAWGAFFDHRTSPNVELLVGTTVLAEIRGGGHK